MVRQEGSEGALVDHQPDYHAPIDHGTSYASHRVTFKTLSLTFTPGSSLRFREGS